LSAVTVGEKDAPDLVSGRQSARTVTGFIANAATYLNWSIQGISAFYLITSSFDYENYPITVKAASLKFFLEVARESHLPIHSNIHAGPF